MENIIEYAIRHTEGKRLVDHVSYDYDYPYFMKNTQVFEDGTTLTVYMDKKEGATFLKIHPANDEVVRDEILW